MHKFSIASLKSLVLTVLHDPQAGTPGLLSVSYSTLAGAEIARLVRPAISVLHDENLRNPGWPCFSGPLMFPRLWRVDLCVK